MTLLKKIPRRFSYRVASIATAYGSPNFQMEITPPEVDRGRMVWELLVRPSMEYAAEVAVQGDLGWRKLEERRQEMKVVFGE